MSNYSYFVENFDRIGKLVFSGGDYKVVRPDDPFSMEVDKSIVSMLPEARLFSFSPSCLQEVQPFTLVHGDQNFDSVLNIPFSCVWVEPEIVESMLRLRPQDCPGLVLRVMGALLFQTIISNGYVALVELEEDGRKYFSLFPGERVFGADTLSGNVVLSSLHTQVNNLFGAMRSKGAIFTEKHPGRYRIGAGADRRLLQPKRIVRVCLRAERKKYESSRGHPIDWSHQWEVMGHWRRVAGTGKDRTGHYCIPGYTWVAPHHKGPEDRTLVRKERKVSVGAINAIG